MLFRNTRRVLSYLKLLRTPDPKLQPVKVEEAVLLESAKTLHAQVYIQRGFVPRSALTQAGLISQHEDPYQNHAQYFAVIRPGNDGPIVVGTARQILAKSQHRHASFPMMSRLSLYDHVRRTIEAADPERCIEISALAKRPGESSLVPLLLYRLMWHHSLAQDHQYWLMACDAKVYGRLKFLFGQALLQAGPKTYYMGSDVIPAVLDIRGSLKHLEQEARSLNIIKRQFRRRTIKFFLEGLARKQRA